MNLNKPLNPSLAVPAVIALRIAIVVNGRAMTWLDIPADQLEKMTETEKEDAILNAVTHLATETDKRMSNIPEPELVAPAKEIIVP